MASLQRIRQCITDRAYYLTGHARFKIRMEWLERSDVEHAILKGRIERKLTHDPRAVRYRVEGPVPDGRTVHVICRMDQRNLCIITVYIPDR